MNKTVPFNFRTNPWPCNRIEG